MDEAPAPSASNCPYCGGRPRHDPNHVLSANGYIHDDIRFTCSDCNRSWTCGVPIGEYDGELAEELFCESCEKRYGLPHRIEPRPDHGDVVLHMKCPNQECFFFWRLKRPVGEGGVVLYGYPQITGSIEDATSPYGYDEDHPDYADDDD